MTVPASQIKYRLFRDRSQFRAWLSKNHQSKNELWLGFHKKGVEKISITNNDAVEEALCFGWINGKVRKLNDEVYIQRFTPRKDKSIWANSNKVRVKKLIKMGLMTEFGLEKIRIAKENGSWESPDEAIDIHSIPDDLELAFKKHPIAKQYFKEFTEKQQRDYLWWISDAKQASTRKRRIDELILRCKKKIRPGMPLV